MTSDGSEPGDDELERLATAAGTVSNKWHPAILYVLAECGPARFNELKGQLGSVSAKVLTDSLEKLGDDDLVERRVLSESPLRVEYGLTARGEDMLPVIEGLLSWSEEHLGSGTPTALVVDDDPRIAEMHADWLDDRFEVEAVYGADAALDRVDGVDVAVLDRGLTGPGTDLFGRTRDAVGAGVVALSATDPGPDLVGLACDEYLTKPTDPETLRAAAADVLDRRGRPRDVREYLALSARREAIREGTTRSQREGSEEYDRLTDRIDRLADRIDGEVAPARVGADATP